MRPKSLFIKIKTLCSSPPPPSPLHSTKAPPTAVSCRTSGFQIYRPTTSPPKPRRHSATAGSCSPQVLEEDFAYHKVLRTLAMKIVTANAGALTNFEVLDLLRSRGAGRDPTRVIASVSPSEFKVYDYIEQTPASKQTREIVREFVEECKTYDLAKAEILNVINIRPASGVEVFTIIEECESRLDEEKTEEFVQTIARVLPPHQAKSDMDIEKDTEETVDGQQAEPVE